jgi:putative PIN family toxin of toxin-antitoxin system
MKVFFDTNVYVAEALLGETAEEIVSATSQARWRVYANLHVLDELERVLTEKLGFSRRLATLSRRRVMRRSQIVETGASSHQVENDPSDSPILQAACAASVDFLVTNDQHLLTLSPYEGVRVISIGEYRTILVAEGIVR